MKPPRRGDPHWDVYLTIPGQDHIFRCIASCTSQDALVTVLAMYDEGEAFWAEVTKP